MWELLNATKFILDIFTALSFKIAMMTKSKYLITLLVVFQLQFYSFSQLDSTDLNFYATAPVLVNSDDTLMYPEDMFQALHLSFELTALPQDGKLNIEMSPLNSSYVVYKKTYTLNQLNLTNLLSNGVFNVSFGNMNNEMVYKVSITFENGAGIIIKTLSKTLSI
jgi:hypothetical protein